MPCGDALDALAAFVSCRETLDGARVETHCRYPSFEPVYVHVVRSEDGFRVHDARGAFNSAWLHGRDEAVIARAINIEADRQHLSVYHHSLIAFVPNREWLGPAIISVANASAYAANQAVSRFVASTETALFDQIKDVLETNFGAANFYTEFEVRGRSGGKRHFDFAIPTSPEEQILINAVSPHHSSINAKYVSFSDVEGDQAHKLAVFERSLETDDIALLQQVASIVPLAAMTQKAISSGAVLPITLASETVAPRP